MDFGTILHLLKLSSKIVGEGVYIKFYLFIFFLAINNVHIPNKCLSSVSVVKICIKCQTIGERFFFILVMIHHSINIIG